MTPLLPRNFVVMISMPASCGAHPYNSFSLFDIPAMAHQEQLEFMSLIRREFPDRFNGGRILEVGSLDINGSVRSNFRACAYVGIDVAPGPGVDVVSQGQDYDAPDASFDVLVSCEVMEHNPHWVETMRNMIRLCKPGGLIVMTCATLGRKEHGTARTSPDASPLTVNLGWDYYRNLTIDDFNNSKVAADTDHVFMHNWISHDLYFIGFKDSTSKENINKINSIKNKYKRAHWASWKSIKHAFKATLKDKRN